MCWIVGRGGAVYLTTDGARFVRLPFPEMVDLVAITATDDRNAIVSAADGRVLADDRSGPDLDQAVNCSNSQLPTPNFQPQFPNTTRPLRRCSCDLGVGGWRLGVD